MANAKYNLGLQAVWSGSIALLTDDIRCLLATNAYTPNLATDQFVSDIPGGAISARSGAFTGKSFSGTSFFAANVTLSLVPAGAADLYVIVYKWTGADATSRLLIKDDTAMNLPVTPIGGDITVQWDPVNGVTQL